MSSSQSDHSIQPLVSMGVKALRTMLALNRYRGREGGHSRRGETNSKHKPHLLTITLFVADGRLLVMIKGIVNALFNLPTDKDRQTRIVDEQTVSKIM